MRKITLAIFAVVFVTLQMAKGAGELTVKTFTPTGDVSKITQARAEFSEDVVKLGNPKALAPFNVDCNSKGTGRWIDTRNWVYDFNKELPAGIRCKFTPNPALKSLAGNALAQTSYEFSTGGPTVEDLDNSWSAHEDGVFILKLDAEPDLASVRKFAYFVGKGVSNRIGLDIIEGDAKNRIVERNWRCKETKPSYCIVVKSKQKFFPGTENSLVWAKGVATKTGAKRTEDQKVSFTVRDPFKVMMNCERVSEDEDCIPIGAIRISLNAEVPNAVAKQISLKTAKGEVIPMSAPHESSEFVSGISFEPPLPPNTELILSLPAGIKDTDGRTPTNIKKFPLKFKTGSYPPLAKFSAKFGILESTDPVLPVTVRNIEQDLKMTTIQPVRKSGVIGMFLNATAGMRARIFKIPSRNASSVMAWLDKVKTHGNEYGYESAKDDRKESVFAKPSPEEYAKYTTDASSGHPVDSIAIKRPNPKESFEVVGIPLKKPGFYIVELESKDLGAALLGKDVPMYVPTSVLVTNMAIHFKWGVANSMVWVTSLDKGEPVSKALVSIRDCRGEVFWKGLTDKNGVAMIEGLPDKNKMEPCLKETGSYETYRSGLLVAAEKSGDFSFTHTSWNEGIESYRFGISSSDDSKKRIGHTIFARTLLRAGDKLHMKHILRLKKNNQYEVASAKTDLPSGLIIEQMGSGQKYELPISFDKQGVAETTWDIPQTAQLGSYQAVLVWGEKEAKNPDAASQGEGEEGEVDESYGDEGGYDGRESLVTGSFNVEEFRVPLMSASVSLDNRKLIAPDSIDLDLSAQYLNGGGATGLNVEINGSYTPHVSPVVEGFPYFKFYGTPYFSGTKKYSDTEDTIDQPVTLKSKQSNLATTLGDGGRSQFKITSVPKYDTPAQLYVEMTYKDPNGELQSTAKEVAIFPSSLAVGIKLKDSYYKKGANIKAEVAVIDNDGKPQANKDVVLEIFKTQNYSHRKKILGGYYEYENEYKTTKEGEFCRGKTDAKGLFSCSKVPTVEGDLNIVASVADDKGRKAYTSDSVVIYKGSERSWYSADEGDRIDLIPEKKSYEPGDTAKIQVRMPFKEATALVAVEAEGVIEKFVTKLTGEDPIVEVPIKADYTPNIFVSVLVVRGRVEGTKPTATIDLGRPAYKLGIVDINTGIKVHTLSVAVSPNKKTFNVRDDVKVKVRVTKNGKEPLTNGEVALAVVDAGLLSLKPNTSWDVLEAMLSHRPYGIENFSAQMQVVGKRHFGLKTVAPGGGGADMKMAGAGTRQLFDTLVFWKSRIKLDKNGEANVDFKLNDSLTAFEVVAIANAGTSEYGTGKATIETTQDIMLLPGITQFVREGDTFPAELTVRNGSDKIQNLQVALGIATGGKSSGNYPTQSVSLPVGASKTLSWKMAVGQIGEKLTYTFTASAAGKELDKIEVSQNVKPAVKTLPQQTTLMQVEGDNVKVEVGKPENALEDRGGIQVAMQAKLSTSLKGVTRYMADYPYSCMEQQVSRAVALQDEKLWQASMAKLPGYLDGKNLVTYFPMASSWRNSGSVALTTYLLNLSKVSGYAVPADIQDKLTESLRKFYNGEISETSYFDAPGDTTMKKLMVLDTLSRFEGGEKLDVASLKISPKDWPTSALIDWYSFLNRKKKDVKNSAGYIKDVESILKSRINYRGSQLTFANEGDELWWLMVSSDTNASRLILALTEFGAWKADVPKLMVGAVRRMNKRGHWDLTTANAWGVLATAKFSDAYETKSVSGTTNVALTSQPNHEFKWADKKEMVPYVFKWPSGPATLTAKQNGSGKPWVYLTSLAAVPVLQDQFSGFTVKKTMTNLKNPGSKIYKVGDTVRVKLEMESQGDMTWVVVNDPVPPGASVLGSGLGGDSKEATRGESSEGWAWPAFQERGMAELKTYYDYVPQGKWTLEYTLRMNNSGSYALPTTRVEAMYSPDMVGESPNAPFVIAQ